MEPGQDAWDYFSGCVPAYCIFSMHLDGILELLRTPSKPYDSTVDELAFIGVVAYTEAFFKDHFASIVNVFPQRVSQLKKGGRKLKVDLTDILELAPPLPSKFGFLLSERLNFGNPKKINALYRDLLLITPFSGNKAAEFDQVLKTRNLLVHHGGMITMQFNREIPAGTRERTFMDSIRVTKAQVCKAAILANEVASDTVRATIARLSIELDKLDPSDARRRVVGLMGDFLDHSDPLMASLRELCAAN